MKIQSSIESIQSVAEMTLTQLDALKEMAKLDIPGSFVFSPPDGSRLIVNSLEDLHTARESLRKYFGWQDHIHNKFFSCGVVIVSYSPNDNVKLPFPFDLWVESPPDSFPEKLLGNCKIVKFEHTDYNIVCPIENQGEL